MNDDRRVVYSTEDGSLARPMRNSSGKSGRKAKAALPVRKAGKQGVRIRRESKGRGGKTVSLVDGLALDDAAMKRLLKQLKGSLGTGGAIKNGCIEIQGDHREKLIQLLEKQGIKARLAGG